MLKKKKRKEGGATVTTTTKRKGEHIPCEEEMTIVYHYCTEQCLIAFVYNGNCKFNKLHRPETDPPATKLQIFPHFFQLLLLQNGGYHWRKPV
jgi:hypothetical protein